MHQTYQIQPVLLPQRLVKSELGLHAGHGFGIVGLLLAENRVDGIRRNKIRQYECDQRDAENQKQADDESFANVDGERESQPDALQRPFLRVCFFVLLLWRSVRRRCCGAGGHRMVLPSMNMLGCHVSRGIQALDMSRP